jgi:hypothetical protein
MAKRIFYTPNQTYTPTATATQFAANTFMGMQGANATQVCDVLEILVAGNATSSTIGGFVFAPSHVAATTPTALASPNTDGPMNVSATALASPYLTFVTATTRPTTMSTATIPVVNLGLNTFGGIIRWNAAPTQQVTTVGNALDLGSWALFNFTSAGGASTTANCHIIYEPY